MVNRNELDAGPSETPAATCVSSQSIGIDGRVAEDLLVSFDQESGELTDNVRTDIARWAQSWATKYPGAIVVMGCNGISRNSARPTREKRLLSLSKVLGECGVSEDRVRYTDDVIEMNFVGCAIPADRGVVCIKVLRSVIIDSAVMPIRDLFGPSGVGI